METKFYEKFVEATNGAFPMLKLNGATYYKAEMKLVVRFIISALSISSFDETKKTAVFEAVQKLFPGVKVEVQYIRTYADYSLVKNKITDFLSNSNKILLSSLTDDNLKIDIDGDDINIKIKLKSHLCSLLNAGDLKCNLIDYLDRSFNYNINLSAEELPDSRDDSDIEIAINTSSDMELGNLRLIDITMGDKLYSKGKIGNTSQLPNYICDVKGDSDNIVLCGKVSNVSRRTYNNKKFDPNDAKKGPMELPMLRFMLDDGTGKMDTVCFPKPDEADKIEFFLSGKSEISKKDAVDDAQNNKANESSADDVESVDSQVDNAPTKVNEKVNKDGEKSEKETKEDTQEQKDVYVVCFGRVSKFRDTYSLTANAIFECEINFDSIHADESKPEPAKYVNVFPENCVTLQQQSFIESAEDEINPYFIGKTFVIYDLETTDVAIDKAHVIQIAALKIVDGIEKQTFESFVNPPIAIPQHITELTHIENSDVIGAPTIEEVMPDFFKFTRGAILVGHNICGYDFPITNRLARDMGYIFDNELLDTYPLAKKYMPEMSNFKLTTLSKSLKIEHLSAHRADSDVYATWGVLKEIAKRM